MFRDVPDVLLSVRRTVRRLKPVVKIAAGLLLILLILVASNMCGAAAAYEIREAPYDRVAPLCPYPTCEPVCVIEVLTGSSGRVCYGWACSCPPIVGGA